MDGRVAHSALAPRPLRLGKPLAYSLGAHALLILLIAVGGSLFSGPSIDLDQKPIQARLVRKGTPRDEKLLPRKEELPPPPQKVEAPPPAPTPAPPAPEAAKVALPGVKPEPAAKKPEPQQGESAGDRRKKLFGAFDKLSKQQPEELEGEADGDELGDAAKAEGDRYWGLINARVRRNYDVSQTIPDAERIRLTADVTVKISRSGEVLKTVLAKSSGNDLFDNAVLLAVKKASPFPPPPDHLRSTLQDSGVTLRFTP